MTRKATEGPCVDFGGASFVQEPVERDITSHFLSKPVYYFCGTLLEPLGRVILSLRSFYPCIEPSLLIPSESGE